MKPTSKMSVVASSPGRADKLPAPPFARLLKGKSGSRSRRSSSSSHSRASPMFVARRRSGSAETEGDKEPGSPKVTCIGQVRIHRKKKKKKKKSKDKGSALPTKDGDQKTCGSTERSNHQQQKQRCDCRCFHRPDFCNPFTKLPTTKRSRASPPQQGTDLLRRRRLWRGWFSPWCCSSSSGRCARESKDQKQLLEPAASAPAAEEQQEPGSRAKPRVSFACSPVRRDYWMTKVADDGNAAAEPGNEDLQGGNHDLSPSTPPKNALLLMRCRSAPQGASSPFTRRFPAPDEPTAPDDRDPHTAGTSSSPFSRFKVQDSKSTASPQANVHAAFGTSANELQSAASGADDDHEDDSSTGQHVEDITDEAAAAVGPSPSFSSLPLILTRCKSEPAHKAAKLASAPPDSSNCLWTVGGATDDNNTNTRGYYSNNNNEQQKVVGQRHR